MSFLNSDVIFLTNSCSLNFNLLLFFLPSVQSSDLEIILLKLHRKIHYLTKEFRVQLYAKTDIARSITCFTNHLLEEENNLHLLLLSWQNGKTKRKHWTFNIAIKGIYFFCTYNNRPWRFFRRRFFDLFGWAFAYHFQGRVHRIFSLSRCRERKRFFSMPLQEFAVHFKTGKNLWLTLKNAFICF